MSKSEKEVKKQEKKQARQQAIREANREVAAQNMKAKQDALYDESGKIVTKYDKKMKKRKETEKKDKTAALIGRIALIAVILAVVVGAVTYAGLKIRDRFSPAVIVDNQKIDKVEFDYYYGTSVSNFMNSYGQYASYFGLDTSKDFSKQQYTDDMTWKDYFSQSAIDILKRSKALVKAANEASFSADITDEYNEFKDSMRESAKSEKVSTNAYYKTVFGDYATEKNIEKVAKEYFLAEKYYEDYESKIVISDDERDKYYDEHKDDYDVVDYRSLMVENTAKANEMLERITDEDSFKELAKEYASEADKSRYETADGSLNSNATKSSASNYTSAVGAWLYSSERKEGDKIVITDSDNNTNHVLYFIKRSVTDTIKATVASDIKNQKLTDYVQGLVDKIEAKSGTVEVKENNDDK